jgi:3-oxoacyl-[acyl-carrier protein] reductase
LKLSKSSNYLVFGATGIIGSACAQKLELDGNVIHGSKNLFELQRQINQISGFDGVIWAQGVNAADDITAFETTVYENVIDANVTFVINSLRVLLDMAKFKDNVQLVVLSSIWGHLSRPNKLSYGISKAALGGLVRSLAADLGPIGFQINAVSPGPIESPMTVKNLKPEEIKRIISETPIKRLVTLEEVSSVVCGLATGKFCGLTGQNIVIDGGWSDSKLL